VSLPLLRNLQCSVLFLRMTTLTPRRPMLLSLMSLYLMKRPGKLCAPEKCLRCYATTKFHLFIDAGLSARLQNSPRGAGRTTNESG